MHGDGADPQIIPGLGADPQIIPGLLLVPLGLLVFTFTSFGLCGCISCRICNLCRKLDTLFVLGRFGGGMVKSPLV
jgi:hypothetical protein